MGWGGGGLPFSLDVVNRSELGWGHSVGGVGLVDGIRISLSLSSDDSSHFCLFSFIISSRLN